MKFKEKLMNARIDMHQFYIMGIVCFFIVSIAGIYTGVVTWNFMDLGSKVSTIFRSIFNFGIVLFFNYLRTTLPQKPKMEEDLDIDNLINQSNL